MLLVRDFKDYEIIDASNERNMKDGVNTTF